MFVITKNFSYYYKNINYSENRNGIFINMNLFSEEIIQEICKYLEYVKEQKNLNDIESLKLISKKIILINLIKKIYIFNNE